MPEKSLAEALPPEGRVLLELAAERLEMATGNWTLEVVLQDGRVQRVFRHEKLSANELGRFDDTTV